jgi:alkaline phosphatase D
MSIGFSGAWFTTFGRLEMVAAGLTVTGAYTHNGGHLEGTRDGALLRGRWREGDRQGPCELTLDPGDNVFRGGWSHDGDAEVRGVWTGVRLALPAADEGGMPGAGNSLPEGPVLSGPMTGECGETDAFVWAQARDRSPLTLVVQRAGGDLRVVAEPLWDEWLCVVFHVEGLDPDTAYTYVVESVHGQTPAQRLRTAPRPDARRARIAFGSCFWDYVDRTLTIFDAIRREEPDLFLMIGDNCYFEEPDWQTPHTMIEAQLRSRNSVPLRRLLAEVPTLAIWDDHDYGPNDSDGSFAAKADALATFRRVWAQRSYGTAEVTGIFSVVRWGPVEIFLTDDRWYRKEKRRILGEAQLAWLCDRLARSDAPVKLLVSGSQVLPQAAAGLDWECWRLDAPGELAALTAFLEEHDIRGVVIASGDVHLGYLLHAPGRALPGARRGPELWELTASPLANDPWHETITGRGLYDPTVLAEHATCNYGVVDVDLDRAGAEVRLVLADAEGNTLAEQPIALSSLAVRPEAPRLSAVVRLDDRLYFFSGGRYVRWETRTGAPAPGYPHPITPGWRGLAPGGFDAAVAWPNGRVYFFKGNGYVAYDLATEQALPGYPKYVAAEWHGLWAEGLDAALVTGAKAYFFRGGEYLRFDVAADRADAGYPCSIEAGWPGLWPDGIDAAVTMPDGKAYFFKGDACIAWDLAADRVEPGYPRPIDEVFPGARGALSVA